MDSTFWDQAFGPEGKNTLRLLLEAKDFRIRKNKLSTVASFNLPHGRVTIQKTLHFSITSRRHLNMYFITYSKGKENIICTAYSLGMIKPLTESLIGMSLSCF